MATNIEQIFRDFVMNKIREIEDEGQHTGVIAEGSSNSGVSYSEEKTGSGKEIAVAMESHGDALEHSSSGEVMKRADSGQIEKVAAVVGVTVSKEGAENPHKKTKKHKRHKSKKKKKKRKLEKESSSESALESGAESRAGVKNQGPPGREGAVKEDKAAGVDVSADQQMEEVDGKPKKHKRHGAKKKKKKKKEAKPERKSTSHSRSESCSASGSESELELKPPPVMLPVSSPVVSLEKNQKNTSFGSPPEKSQEKVSLLAVEEVVPMKCEMIVHSCGDNSKAMDIDKMVSSERAAGQVANLSENQPNLPDIISKLEDAHNEEPIKIGSDMPTGAQENQELVNEERCRSCSSSRSMTRLLTQGKTAVPLCTSSQKSPNCSQTPTQILDKPYSQKAHSSSRSTSRRRSSPRKKHSRSLSESRRSRSQSVKRSGRKSRSSSIRKRQYSDSRSSLRNRRSRSRSRHRTKSRSVVRRRRSRSGSRSRHRTVRSRSKRSRSQRNQRSRSTRRGRRFRSRSHSHQRRPLSHSRRSHSTSVRRTKRTRSRSIVIRRRSRSKSAFRRNRWSRSRSFRWKRSKSRSVRRRRSKSRSLWRSRRSKSRSPSRQRRSKTPSSRRSKRSKSRSPARHRCSKSPRGGQKQSERSKQSMSRSLSKTKSKSRSVSGEIESHEKSPFTAEQGISGCPSKEVVTTGMAPTEIHAIGSGTVKREEVSAVSTEVSIQSVDLGGSSVKEETPVDSCGLKLEHAFEEKSIDNANKAASSVGSWRPIPLLVDSSANPQPTFVVESLSSTPLVVVTSTEPTDESISLQMNAIEKCTTSQLPPTSQDLLLHSPLHDTSKDNHQNSTTSSVFEDRGKESKFSSRSFSPQSSKPSKSLPLVLKNPLLEISDPVLSTEIKLESDVKCPHEQRSTSPGRHESSETETKPDNSRSCLASKVDEHPLEKRDSEPKCPFSKKENSSKDGQSSVVASPTRSKRSKSRSLSKTKTSQSFARQKRSKSNSSSRRRRSHSLSTSRRKKSKSRSPRRKRSRSWSRSRKKKSKSPTKRRRSRSKSVMKIKKSRSKSTSRTTKRKRSKSRTPVKKKRSNSRSSWRGKRSKSRSMARKKRSKSVEKTRRSKSLSPGRKRRMRSRSTNRNRRSRSRRSRSLSRRRRGGFRSNSFDRRDRWRREPSHSPVVILRKKRSTSHNRRSTSKTPPRLTELDKDQLLEIAKANAAVMCAKVGMPIPESLRPKALPQLSLPNSVSSPLSMSLPLSMNLSMGMSMGMPNITMNAAMATMTAATMTAALTNMGALANMPALPALPTITTKPQPTAMASTANIEEVKRKVTQKANSISIKELTEKCKMIAESKEEMAIAQPHMSDDEEDEKTFGGGALRETKGISFSLSNPSVKPAVRTEAAFAKEFPVSSGSQHRKKENEGAYGEWVPVEKKMEKDKAAAVSVAGTTAEEECKDSDSVFPDTPLQPVDITLAVSERAAAQKRLAENPFDVNAICMLSRAQEQVDAWAQSNSIPGLFTGSTGAQVLSSEELSNSGPQAWIKKDQFLRAAPVSGGVGEFLMRKMGWRVGEGLGKYKEGTVEPIVIDFKTDRKGLVAEGEKMQKSGSLVVMKDLLGKHPVSALMEICNKKKWAPPEFVMVHHSGPDHRKNFLFKVVVNGTDYQPQTASPNKKHAKAMAATVALQAMGEVSGEKVHTGPVFTAATSTG